MKAASAERGVVPYHAPANADYLRGGIAMLLPRPFIARVDTRILIADDHPIVRTDIKALVANEADMRVVAEAGDGGEAVDLYASEQPDVVLMDLRMPRMDGIA